jgi:2-oxoglutarate dehydrogenase E1 component
VLLCSGKVYYDLVEKRGEGQGKEIAILRLEQFYPFPAQMLERVLARYRKAKDYVWVQEESLNMGGWAFVEPRLRALGCPLKYVGRDTSASPATGSRLIHLREQRELVEAALGAPAPHLVRSSGDGQAKPKSGDSVILRPGVAQAR